MSEVCTCLNCGCDDYHACQQPSGEPCHWSWLDVGRGLGVCSVCSELALSDISGVRSRMRLIFEPHEQRSAIAFAEAGGQALQLLVIVGHLFDTDEIRLAGTAKALGVQRPKIAKAGTSPSHIELCGEPLKRCLKLFSKTQKLLPISEAMS